MSSPDLANLSPNRALLAIADAYLQGESTLSDAVRLARRRGGIGEYFSGEMALQGAFDTNQQDIVNMAAVHFKRAASAGKEPLMAYGLRSKFRHAQLGLYHTLIAGKGLPTHKSVRTVYSKMVKVGYEGIRDQDSERTSLRDDNAIELVGTNTEIAVGILAMREALKIDADVPLDAPVTWLPLQSTFRQDQGNDCLQASPDAWDLSIWTDLAETGPEIAYKVQIKTNEHTSHGQVYDTQDVVNLNVLPELALRGAEPSIGRIIIVNAFHELNDPLQIERITNDLDCRGALLLDAIDK